MYTHIGRERGAVAKLRERGMCGVILGKKALEREGDAKCERGARVIHIERPSVGMCVRKLSGRRHS